MKTNLDRTITTIQEADAFITELHSNGELFHFDDDIRDMEGIEATEEESEAVDRLTDQIFSLARYDPFEKAMELLGTEREKWGFE